MTEAETEAETLARLETALKRIGDLARQPRPHSGHKPEEGQHPPEFNREALLHSLDVLIDRLRHGLELPNPHLEAPHVNDGEIE